MYGSPRSILTAAILVAFVVGIGAQADAEDSPPPNVVLIVIDTLRADLLGCYGHEVGASPEIDALAREGILFENAISPCSWTRPSMGAMLTSRYPRSLGLYKERGEILNDDFTTLAEYLKAEGYSTLGVTANPVINSVFNMHQGFDEYLDSTTVFSWMKSYVADDENAELRQYGKLPSAPEVFQSMFGLLDENPNGPYYLQINLMEIHEAWRWKFSLTREAYSNMYRSKAHRKYLRALRQVSSDIGGFVERLRARPGFEDTLFVIASDHGQGMNSHRHVPLSSFHGRIVYESQVMVPLIFHHPGSDLSSRRVKTPVRLLDVAPTLLEYLGGDVPDGLDGVSLMPIVRGGETAPGLPDAVIVETEYRRYKKIGIYAPPWKYIENRDGHRRLEPTELQPWGIHEDGPWTDQSDEHPEVVETLRRRLHDWEAAHPRMPATPMETPLDSESLEQLRSIGYVGN